MRAVEEAEVPALLYASSIGVYSPGPKDRTVGEDWARNGVSTSYYARQKAEVERRLDSFEGRTGVRVVRMRPGLVFKREAAEGIRRLFGGPLFPSAFARPELINFVPEIEDLRSQVVHSHDVGEAFRLALVQEGARGAFNLATEPVLDAQEIGNILGARPVPVPARLARAGAELSWRLRLQPAPPGWLDLARGVPIMDTTCAREELGWTPQHDARYTLLDVLEGLRRREGLDTPVLSPTTSGPFRVHEILTDFAKAAPSTTSSNRR